jgi:hypothetical protein
MFRAREPCREQFREVFREVFKPRSKRFRNGRHVALGVDVAASRARTGVVYLFRRLVLPQHVVHRSLPATHAEVELIFRRNNPSLRKTAFLSHLYTKTIILPRQARDKHRETSKNDAVFRTGFSCIYF